MRTTNTSSSTSGWKGYHRRADAVKGVLADLDRSTELPWDDTLAAVFLDPDDLLEALHAVWTRRLLARVDLELEIGSGTPRQSVGTAWQATAQQLSALRALLDRYAGTEVAQRCVAGEHRLLAVAAGLATLTDPAARSAELGAGLVATLRRSDTPRPAGRHRRPHGHRFSRLFGCRHLSTAA